MNSLAVICKRSHDDQILNLLSHDLLAVKEDANVFGEDVSKVPALLYHRVEVAPDIFDGVCKPS